MKLLSEGKSQDENNVLILYPNHHRMLHYAAGKLYDDLGTKRKIIIDGDEKSILYK